MVSLATHMVLQMALLSSAGGVPVKTYRDAYHQAERRQQPLLVLVGDDSSSDYRTMKTEYLPALARQGVLEDIAVAVVDRDEHPEMAKRILQGAAAPQLVLYTHRGRQWQRGQLTAAESVAEVRAFIERTIATASTTSVEPTFSAPIQWGSS